MTDLFTGPPDYQDALRELMIASHKADLADLKSRGIRPPWQEQDYTLQEDEYRLLKLVDERISLPVDDFTVIEEDAPAGMFGKLPAFKVRKTLTSAIGMKADNNSAAVINRCIANGWLNDVYSDGARYLELTDDGQDALWDHEGETST